MRVILYTGKGGVGKTSVAAASAVRCAELGYKTMVLSSDTAHSLADCFDIDFGEEVQQIGPNLWAQETILHKTAAREWERIQRWLVALFKWKGVEEIKAEEMTFLPGMEEIANLLYIIYYKQERFGKYDVTIVDCAPTGETFRLLSFPEAVQWWMEKLFPLGRKAVSLVRPFSKIFTDIPVPESEIFKAMEDLISEIRKVQELLTNSDECSVRLVLNPEKMVIKETQRAFTYFNLYGFMVDLVILNRIFPEEISDPFFKTWKKEQDKYCKLIEENFAPLPIIKVPFFDQEIVGLTKLKELAEILFKNQDPTQFFFKERVQEIVTEKDAFVFTIYLPFLRKEEISLVQKGDELILQTGKYQRNIVLPSSLRGLNVQKAKFEEDKLKIRFQKRTT